MKSIFVNAEYNQRFSISESFIKNIPKRIGLVTTIQFSKVLKEAKKKLQGRGKKVLVYKKGLILGCNFSAAKNIEKKVNCFLYIGSGKFHPLQFALSLKTKKPIFCFNPLTQEHWKLDWQEVERIKARKKAQIIKILSSDKIGILISIKPGQNNLYQALKLKKRLEKKGKEVYLFLFDNLDLEQFENFKDIALINTACPGLSLENNLVHLSEIVNYF